MVNMIFRPQMLDEISQIEQERRMGEGVLYNDCRP